MFPPRPNSESERLPFDLAQICPNGHVANKFAGSSPESNTPHCAHCGEQTITVCPKCNNPIRGSPTGMDAIFNYYAPAYCIHCGAPFPWTERRAQAAIDLFLEESMSKDDDEKFKQSVADIARDTPQARVGASRITKLLKKVGVGTANAIRDILVQIAADAIKGQILSK